MEQFNNLVNWIKENGGYIDDDIYLEVVGEGNRTLRTSQDKNNSEILIKIPKKCTITEKEDTENFNAKISLKLLQEFSKGDESFYKYYLHILPSPDQLSTHPFYKYDEKDLEKIKDISIYVYNYLNSFHIRVDEFYEKYVKDDVNIKDKFKTKEWSKYVLTLSITRSWGIYGFIPVIDMIQHGLNLAELNCVSQNDEGKLCFLNRKNLTKDCELSHIYNTYSNINLYLNYNILNNTGTSFIPFQAKLNNNDKLHQYQKDCLKVNGFDNIDNDITFIFLEEFNNLCLIISRILQMTEIDMKILPTIYGYDSEEDLNKIDFKSVVSMRNEFITVKFLINVINSLKIPIQNRDYEYETIINLIDKHNELLDKNLNYLKKYWQSLIE